MAAVTVTRRRSVVFGNKRVILATITTAATGDTFDTKLKLLDAVSIEPLQAAQPAVSATTSAGVVTVNYSGGGGGTFTVIAIGNG